MDSLGGSCMWKYQISTESTEWGPNTTLDDQFWPFTISREAKTYVVMVGATFSAFSLESKFSQLGLSFFEVTFDSVGTWDMGLVLPEFWFQFPLLVFYFLFFFQFETICPLQKVCKLFLTWFFLNFLFTGKWLSEALFFCIN